MGSYDDSYPGSCNCISDFGLAFVTPPDPSIFFNVGMNRNFWIVFIYATQHTSLFFSYALYNFVISYY